MIKFIILYNYARYCFGAIEIVWEGEAVDKRDAWHRALNQGLIRKELIKARNRNMIKVIPDGVKSTSTTG